METTEANTLTLKSELLQELNEEQEFGDTPYVGSKYKFKI